VLVLPSDEALSTPAVFREADRLGLPRDAAALAERAAAVRASLAAGQGELADDLVVNELEPAARSLCPSIDAALADARAAGADHALVSGSGPTVVGLFRSPQAARDAAVELTPRRQAIASAPLARDDA
jgi:4-diphosphocytidyl-2-C-methyl-D-erythritol kinase